MAAPYAQLAVPPSILDTDLYKFSMQQAVLQTFPDVDATYRFTNRNSHTTFSRQCFEQFRAAVSTFSLLELTPDERLWLSKSCPFLSNSYLDYLAAYRYKPEQVHIRFHSSDDDQQWGQVEIEVTGPWVETILWEVPLMACLSQTYFQTVDIDWNQAGQEELAYTKGKRLLEANCSFSEFGTRRRRSFHTQEVVLRPLVQASKDVHSPNPGRLLGTSNVHFARLFGIEPVGTIAHEWFMAVAALTGYDNANGRALDLWEKVYPSNVSLIALTDTFTTDAFFTDFALDPERAERWTGLRQDSGDPNLFAPRVKHFYESLGIDPANKLVVFSDALTVDKAIGLRQQCASLGLNKISFGIGTHLTNDYRSLSNGGQEKSKALNIVIKLKEVDTKPCVKLSDDLTKTTGDKEVAKHIIGLYHLSRG
ncbi:nicotinate phosphoribosyltransferase [Coprinopsis marcescibilis]|uniref:Nicotinate phosphoribosyltransferase n=1 Tax=Coprinopsis marcescibilis TaxID=230819 RepID=A0A5C3LI28_COPMA|nr:nicotinate phosphoribosyltransferase [Coprinopsis marcescibilis]